MSLRPRSAHPARSRAAADDGRFVVSLGRGRKHRQVAIAPGAFYAIVALLPAIAAVYLGATAYLFFRDDMIAALMSRHARQQYAYEDRLAALRLQIDRIAGRQMLDQDSFDGKLREMVSRQARIETRAAVLASLGDVVGTTAQSPSAETTIAKSARAAPVAASGKVRPAPVPLEASMPIDNPEPAPSRPRPEETGLRPSADAAGSDGRPSAALTLAEIAADDVPAGLRLGTLTSAIDRVERSQVAVLRRLEAPATALATRLRAAIAATGLTAERLKLAATTPQSAVGGPYVPLRIDPHSSEFDAQLARTQAAVLTLDAARRLVPALPLRKPLSGPLEQTSSFGYRLDPFLGRPALHSGLDFRGDYGSSVRATATGKVVTAGPSGGYGNMVEIEHGNGVSTRYGHLSAVLVTEGQVVPAGTLIGRVGSTGRSTGNHLHYEVRLDDDAVDPTRFIRAANMLAGD